MTAATEAELGGGAEAGDFHVVEGMVTLLRAVGGVRCDVEADLADLTGDRALGGFTVVAGAGKQLRVGAGGDGGVVADEAGGEVDDDGAGVVVGTGRFVGEVEGDDESSWAAAWVVEGVKWKVPGTISKAQVLARGGSRRLPCAAQSRSAARRRP